MNQLKKFNECMLYGIHITGGIDFRKTPFIHKLIRKWNSNVRTYPALSFLLKGLRIGLVIGILLLGKAALANPHKVLLPHFVLESNDTLQSVQLSFSRFGSMNADSSNVVLVCTWFTGTSPGVGQLWTSGSAYLDTTLFAVIVADAPGNGLAVSPSNKTGTFPDITLADMVHMQHRLLTQYMGLQRVYAIAGISMGGMQAWQWAALYPAFTKKVIAISATPVQSTYDLLFWNTTLQLLQLSLNIQSSQRDSILKTIAMLQELHLYTPQYRNSQTDSNAAAEWITNGIAFAAEADPQNWISQVKAMIRHDVFRYRTKAQWKPGQMPKMLIIVPENDLMVNPEASITIARYMNAKLLLLKDNCGHQSSVLCGRDKIKETIKFFLGLENGER